MKEAIKLIKEGTYNNHRNKYNDCDYHVIMLPLPDDCYIISVAELSGIKLP
jgi:predicted RNase H-like HicB family nuclease